MAGLTGLEPATFRVTGGRSNQLSYNPKGLNAYGPAACPPKHHCQWFRKRLVKNKSSSARRRELQPHR